MSHRELSQSDAAGQSAKTLKRPSDQSCHLQFALSELPDCKLLAYNWRM